MARKKLTAGRRVQTAKLRKDGSKSIEAGLSLGDDLKISDFEAMLTAHDAKIENYNTLLSTLDQMKNEIGAGEREIGIFSERWLKAVGVKYGFDSDEYEMAGGTRKSERKKPAKGNAPTP